MRSRVASRSSTAASEAARPRKSQEIVVNKAIRNFPEKGVYAWEPSAHLGAYRIDELYFAE